MGPSTTQSRQPSPEGQKLIREWVQAGGTNTWLEAEEIDSRWKDLRGQVRRITPAPTTGALPIEDWDRATGRASYRAPGATLRDVRVLRHIDGVRRTGGESVEEASRLYARLHEDGSAYDVTVVYTLDRSTRITTQPAEAR